MRTLQEKYNAIQQGKFSKEHFLAEARMQQPQLVTRFNGYNDAVQILKNKGMIVEAYSAEEGFKDYSNDALTDMIINLSRYEDNEDSIARVKAELARRRETLQEAKKEEGKKVTDHPFIVYTDKKGKHQLDEFNYEDDLKAFCKTIPNTWDVYETRKEASAELRRRLKENPEKFIKEAKLTKKSLTDYRYKPTNDMDKYPYEQILRGIRVELEVAGVHGTPTAEEYSKALAKVSKNLAKDSIFYTNQVAGVNPKVDLHDKMVPVTAKNTVDTFNGMKKAELKEGFKKLIKKVLSEEVVDVESYKEDEVYEMYGEDDMDESAMGDIYLLAQEHDRFEHFVQAVEDEFGPVEDIAELEHIFNSTRGEDDIDYGDENSSDAEIDTEYESPSDRMYNSDAWVQAQQDMMETRKAKSLSELLK